MRRPMLNARTSRPVSHHSPLTTHHSLLAPRALRLAPLAAVALLVACAGCPREKASTTVNVQTGGGGPAGGGGAHYTLAVIPKGTSQSFWLAVKAGADDAGKEEGATIIWEGPADETDVDGQIRIVQNATTRRVSAIVMAACNASSLVPYVKSAQDAGIPVVTIDSGIKPDISAAFLATDNVKGGEVAAEALAEAVGGNGKVGLLPFIKGAGSSDDREKGFIEGLKKMPGLTLVSTLYSNSQVDQGLDKTKTMITSHPDIAGVFAANQGGAEGAIKAVQELNKVGQVKLVCYDGSEVEIQALKDGVVNALIVQNPYRMGYEGVKTAIKAIKHEPIQPRVIDTGVTKVTKADLDKPEIQKLLNPQTK